MSKGTVYLINAKGTNRYKIGYTNRPFEQRLTELSGGQSPFPLIATKTILVEDAHTIELGLHHKFTSFRKHGEWFEFDNRQIKEVCKAMDKMQSQRVSIPKPIPFLLMIAGLITLLSPLFLKQCQQPQFKTTPSIHRTK
ncbi:GIY-YIG nuclease family protein [Nostoc sp. GT001]|uniref:GIY-YIG nuclease family protein n=1 Tax=Nostoc sp. GT001 TaxID=3056647 RepID=UPI0025AA7BAE|nr:GIY-YIG nuclease family protein [Nostoc sp. GT001]MDM9583149.1 GIY-YIG nuclease family protein [Nostoc sp. GT001]